jgi:hypothetical protein
VKEIVLARREPVKVAKQDDILQECVARFRIAVLCCAALCLAVLCCAALVTQVHFIDVCVKGIGNATTRELWQRGHLNTAAGLYSVTKVRGQVREDARGSECGL